MSSAEEIRLAGLRKLLDDFPMYCEKCLKVKPKDGGFNVPLKLNQAQLYIHERLERQLKDTGKVRAIVLKGRQQGASTYIGARFYKKTSTTVGMSAFIMAHEDKATNNLYSMVKRYHQHNPIAPSTGATNAKELVFDKLDGGYKLATAGSKDVGRSNAVQLFHGSEAGFWQGAAMHMAGIGNTIANAAGTEIILESTGNGLGNTFHQFWEKAIRGESEYIAIFVPWFWQEEYRTEVRDNLDLSEKDHLYMLAYELSMEQMQWRADKISEYDAGMEWLFDQEYPATPAHAFQSGSTNPLISPDKVSAAATSKFRETRGVVIVGVDPSEGVEGGDRTAIVWRRGRSIFRIEHYKDSDCSSINVAGKLADYWRNGLPNGTKPDAIIIDRGYGSGIIDLLRERNIPVIPVHFAGSAENDKVYANKRAEMGYRLLAWFNDTPNVMVNDPLLVAEMSVTQGGKFDSHGRKLLEGKKEMAKRGVKSPNLFDAAMLTLAENVGPRSDGDGYGAPVGHGEPATAAGY